MIQYERDFINLLMKVVWEKCPYMEFQMWKTLGCDGIIVYMTSTYCLCHNRFVFERNKLLDIKINKKTYYMCHGYLHSAQIW